MYMHWTERKSMRPSVRPSGVCGQDCDVMYGPIFTKFGTQLTCIIQKKGFFKQFDSIIRNHHHHHDAHASPLIDRHLQLSSFAQTINVVFTIQSSFCVDYLKMAELVFVTVFNTHMCRKKVKLNVRNLRNGTISDRRTENNNCVNKCSTCTAILRWPWGMHLKIGITS